ncbi:MAG: hypothetical protein AMK69_17050 [Nitrospira bacterium SG8_3]|nr:MAG: hypothetical protein AMK69_17050 [Nitrospira bacterium SG8_3]
MTGNGNKVSSFVRLLCLLFVLAFGFTTIVATGGGGGGGGSSSGTSSGTGSVALLLADGPADDFEKIYIKITEVLLIPPEGSGREPVVVYRNPSGIKVNLLDLRDEDFLFTVKRNVRPGVFEKIRLVISEIQPVGGPCGQFKLSSGKIDLNPRGSFEVVRGETLSIRLDIDANKSINISASCNFRPVVFVDIETGAPTRPCPRILAGTINRIVKRDGIVVGFVLDLTGQRGELEVRVTDDTAVFDQNGEFGGRELLDGQEREQVKVRGRLDENARLEASVVVLGQVLEVKGEVDGPVDNSTGVELFPFTPFPGEELVGQRNVEVADETLILIGCDTEIGKGAIQAGMISSVIGKSVSTNGPDVLRAVVIFLKAREVSGEIVSIVDEAEGKTVTVRQETGGDVDVFVPWWTPIKIEGDGYLPMDLFCEGRQVRILIDLEILDPLTATLVLVEAARREGQVVAVDDFDRSLTLASGNVTVQPDATILDTSGTPDGLVEFEEILPGDHLKYFGLEACPNDTGFSAFVILITERSFP